ncbi:MAG TPA: DUF6492 family protein [Smithella sp.]|nr:DUF6492 family protein [Smithella sp.]HRS97220.1 DUF6492 family protein [Smithella sp.]
MNNLVIFTASYINDLDRLEILKASVDKFNADKIPFYIVVPQKDLDIIQNRITTGKEPYELYFVADEDILEPDDGQMDGWRKQQLKKLAFWELGLCNFYVIMDSDVYFIRDFHVSDFMRDENSPYLSMDEVLETQDKNYAKNYFRRTGKNYTFVFMGQVFSKFVLEDMKKNVLDKNGLSWRDLISLSPWEFQWYGEYFLQSRIHELLPTNKLVKSFRIQLQYVLERFRGYTPDDFVNQGYIAVHMQNRWVKDKVYRPMPWTALLRRAKQYARRLISS